MVITLTSPTANSSIACSAGASGTYTLVLLDPKRARPGSRTAMADLPEAQIAITVTPPGPQALAVNVPCLVASQSSWSCSSFPVSLAGKTGCTVKVTLTDSSGRSCSASAQNVGFIGQVPIPPVPPVPPVPPGPPPPARPRKRKAAG